MPVNISGNDGALVWDAQITEQSFAAQLDRIERRLQGLTDNVGKSGDKIEEYFKRASVAAASFFSLQAGENFIKQMVQVRGEFQDIESSFRTMLGSKEKADQLMAAATKLAANTPFSLTEVAAGSKQLLAYGFAADGLTNNLTMLGNVASGLKVPLGDLIYLYGTLKASGRVTQMDINQFAGRGIPIYEALATVLKKNTDQVRGLVSAGQVGFPEIEQAFQSMTGAGGKFFNLMDEQSKNLNGRISNLGDAFDQLLNNLGKQNEGFINSALVGATNLVNNYQKVLDIIKELIIVYGIYQAAVITTTAVQRVMAEGQLQMALAGEAATTSAVLYNGALAVLNQGLTAVASGITRFMDATKLSNPYIALAAATAAAGVLTYKAFNSEVDYGAKATAAYSEQLRKEQGHLDQVFDKLKSTKAGTTERKDAINELTSKYGEYLPKMDLEKASLADLTDLYKKLNERLDDNVRLRVKQQQVDIVRADAGNIINDQVERIGKQLEGSGVQLDVRKLNELISKAESGKIKLGPGNNGSSQDVVNAQNFVKQVLGVKDLSKVSTATQMVVADALNQIQVAAEREFTAKSKLDKLFPGATPKVESKGKALTPEEQAELDRVNRFAANLKDAYKNVDQLIADSRNKADITKVKETLQAQTDALAPTVDKTKYRAKLDEIAKIESTYTAGYDKRVNQEAENALAKRNEIYGKLGDLHAGYLENQKTQDEKEIEQTKKKYDAVLKVIDDYNAKHAKKIDPTALNIDSKGRIVDKPVKGGSTVDIVKEEKNAVADVTARQSVKSYKDSLDAQKQLFDQYQQYVEQYGRAEADKEFGDKLQGAKTYYDYLKNEQAKLQGTSGADVSVKTDLLGKLLPEAELKQRLKDFDDLQKAMQSTMTFAERAQKIINDYQRQSDTLQKAADDARSKGNETLAGQLEARKVILMAAGQAEIDAMVQGEAEKIDSYRDLGNEIQNLTIAQATLRINQARTTANEERKSAALTEDGYKVVIDIIDKARKSLKANEFGNNLLALGSSFDALSQSAAGFSAGISSTLKSLGDFASQAGSAVKNITALKGAIKDYSANKEAAAQQTGSSFLGSVSATSSIISLVTGVISTVVSYVGAVIKFFKAAKETAKQSAAELLRYQDSLISGQIAYNQLLRDQQRTLTDINNLTTEQLKLRQQLLNTQTKQAQSDADVLLAKIQSSGQQITGEHTEKYGGFLGIGKKTRVVQDKAGLSGYDYDELDKLYTEGKLDDATKAWFEQLKKVHEELEGINDDTQAAADQLAKIATGTMASDITNTIIQGFKNGKRSAADFADDFKGMMQDALISSLINSAAFKSQIDQFYKDFTDASESDGGLTDDKINTLRDKWNNILKYTGDQIDNIEKVTGGTVGSSASSSNSLSGAIKGMSEQTGDLIAGQFGGQRIATLQLVSINQSHYDLAKNSFEAASKFSQQIIAQGIKKIELLTSISDNTGATAKNTADLADIKKALQSIDKKTGSGNATLNANGFN